MATSEPTRGNFQASGLDAVRLVDLIAKAAIVLAAVIYGCGFLVVSLHRHSYGLAEPNPLRPKVLAAGILFLVFAALPIVIFIEAKRFRSPSPDCPRYRRTIGAALDFYTLVSFSLGYFLKLIFEIPPLSEPSGPSTGTITLAIALSATIVFADKWERFPHWLVLPASLASCGLLMFCGGRDLFLYHHQSPASIALWFMVISGLISLEMRARSWKLQLGNWPQSLGLSLTALAMFSTIYYPQIQTSWGGGAPIPAIIYFAKDSPLLPNRNISARILDETDGGYYMIGGNDKKATFIPRSEVAMVYYSDDSSGPFVLKTK